MAYKNIVFLLFFTVSFAYGMLPDYDETSIAAYCIAQDSGVSQKIFACCALADKNSLMKVNKYLNTLKSDYYSIYCQNPLVVTTKQAEKALDFALSRPSYAESIKQRLLHCLLHDALICNSMQSTSAFLHLMNQYRCDGINQRVNGLTLLEVATNNYNVCAIEKLLEHKDCNVNVEDYQGWTPLHIACEKNYIEIVKALLANRAIEVNKLTKDNGSPLSIAAGNGNTEIVCYLMNYKGCLVNSIYPNIPSPLHLACQEGHLAVVKALVADKRVHANALCDGYSPFFLAAQNGHADVIRFLLEHVNINVNLTNSKNLTPLCRAIRNNHVQVVKILCKNGADINASCVDGTTPLLIASEKGHLKFVKMLLSLPEVLINKKGVENASPLYIASQNGHDNIVKVFLEREDIDVFAMTAVAGLNCLHVAAQEGHTAIMQLLLEHSPQLINTRTLVGFSPLHLSVGNNRRRATKLLLATKNVNPNIIDNDDRTPLDIACARMDGRALELLIQHGAKHSKDL